MSTGLLLLAVCVLAWLGLMVCVLHKQP